MLSMRALRRSCSRRLRESSFLQASKCFLAPDTRERWQYGHFFPEVCCARTIEMGGELSAKLRGLVMSLIVITTPCQLGAPHFQRLTHSSSATPLHSTMAKHTHKRTSTTRDPRRAKRKRVESPSRSQASGGEDENSNGPTQASTTLQDELPAIRPDMTRDELYEVCHSPPYNIHGF